MVNDIALTDEDRERLLAEHPIVTHDYIVITPEIKEVYGIVRERVWLRRTGTFMHASPRTGKTYCGTAIERLLKAEFPNIYIIMLLAGNYRSHSVNGFVEDMADAARLAAVSASKKKNLNHLVLHIMSETENRGGNQFVLLIDEMQLLRDMEFYALLTIHNRLERENIRMTTIGFAQPDIVYRANMFREAGESNLIARFLNDPISFHGCSSKNELRKILSAYDDNLFYPADSIWSFTRFFAPQAVARGLRLEDYADTIWDALLAEAGLTADKPLPMEHVSLTIENILLSTFGCDSPELRMTDESILKAAKKSGLAYFTKQLYGSK